MIPITYKHDRKDRPEPIETDTLANLSRTLKEFGERMQMHNLKHDLYVEAAQQSFKPSS